jgi:heme iron utilization protein
MNKGRRDFTQGKEGSLKQMLEPFDGLRFAVLATSDEGRPYASLIAFALSLDRHMVIFATPKATRKYRNMRGQRSVSILIDSRTQTPQDLSSAEAVTLIGTVKSLRGGAKREECARIFRDKHPQLSGFIDEPGTALMTVVIEEVVHVTRFQNVVTWTKED